MAQSSYYTAWLLTNDPDLLVRVAASAQQESDVAGAAISDPQAWAQERRWEWATQAQWIQAVQSAIDVGITEWGKSPTVVTDQYILSYVQAALAAEPEADAT